MCSEEGLWGNVSGDIRNGSTTLGLWLGDSEWDLEAIETLEGVWLLSWLFNWDSVLYVIHSRMPSF